MRVNGSDGKDENKKPSAFDPDAPRPRRPEPLADVVRITLDDESGAMVVRFFDRADDVVHEERFTPRSAAKWGGVESVVDAARGRVLNAVQCRLIDDLVPAAEVTARVDDMERDGIPKVIIDPNLLAPEWRTKQH